METKFYTPEIEEFHVGFEYEYLEDWDGQGNEIWEKKIIDHPDEIYHNNHSDRVRVKHLDCVDIESLGWEHDSTMKSESFFLHKDFNMVSKNNWLVYNEKENSVKIHDMNNHDLGFNFYGSIKNKSELKRLMKQLNIKTS